MELVFFQIQDIKLISTVFLSGLITTGCKLNRRNSTNEIEISKQNRAIPSVREEKPESYFDIGIYGFLPFKNKALKLAENAAEQKLAEVLLFKSIIATHRLGSLNDSDSLAKNLKFIQLDRITTTDDSSLQLTQKGFIRLT